jgi:hypothetical protein
VTNFHAVYRVDDPGTANEQWSSYSFPHGIYVAGATLDEVRDQFKAAAAFAVHNLDDLTLIEHIERPLAPGAYIRTAVDRHTLDRDETAELMRASLGVPTQRDEFLATIPISGSGDAVMLACVPNDRLAWVFEQMDDHDALGLCAPGPAIPSGRFIWWSFILGNLAEDDKAARTETIAEAGLTEESTVAAFMRANAMERGRRLVTVTAG